MGIDGVERVVDADGNSELVESALRDWDGSFDAPMIQWTSVRASVSYLGNGRRREREGGTATWEAISLDIVVTFSLYLVLLAEFLHSAGQHGRYGNCQHLAEVFGQIMAKVNINILLCLYMVTLFHL